VGPLSSAPTLSPPAAAAPNPGWAQPLGLVQLDGASFPVDTLAGKVVLVVNVASKCGYTPQYEALEKLYESHKDRGFVIVGAPCNQFMGQEPGKPEEIATFCKLNYGVTFPLLEKQDVNGEHRSKLYSWLISSPVGENSDVKWNFEKFLIARDGSVVGRWRSATTPDDAGLLAKVEEALGK
jgi:glutathione peroxidase